jgi:predicted transcriptional regulator
MNENAAPDKKHSFSAPFARKYTIEGAIIARYIAHMIKEKHHKRDGNLWCYLTIDHLAERFPYLGRTTVYAATQSLINAEVLKTGNYNKKDYDKTVWYTFASAADREAVNAKLYYFNSNEAEAYDLMAAIVLTNLRSWLKEGPRTVSAKELAKLYGCSRSTVGRALNKLLEEQLLKRNRRKYTLTPKASNPNDNTRLERGFCAAGKQPKSTCTKLGALPTPAGQACAANKSAATRKSTTPGDVRPI